MGGGPDCVLSLFELVAMLRSAGILQREAVFSDWRDGRFDPTDLEEPAQSSLGC